MHPIRFYFSVVAEVPKILRGRAEAMTFWIAIPILVAVLIKPDLGKIFDDPKLTRQIASAILVVCLGQALLRANYAKYQALATRLAEADSLYQNKNVRDALQTALGNLRNSYLAIMNDCTAEVTPAEELLTRMDTVDQWCYAHVHQFLNGGEASLLNAAAVQPLDINAMALARSDPNGKRPQIYLRAQHKANTLGDLIRSRRVG